MANAKYMMVMNHAQLPPLRKPPLAAASGSNTPLLTSEYVVLRFSGGRIRSARPEKRNSNVEISCPVSVTASVTTSTSHISAYPAAQREIVATFDGEAASEARG